MKVLLVTEMFLTVPTGSRRSRTCRLGASGLVGVAAEVAYSWQVPDASRLAPADTGLARAGLTVTTQSFE
jgi:hypothetical protein